MRQKHKQQKYIKFITHKSLKIINILLLETFSCLQIISAEKKNNILDVT